MFVKWLSVNILTVLTIITWTLWRGYDSNLILLGKIFAQAAFVLFLINVNMYFVFLLIRKSKIRDVKVKLAKLSKRMMKYHIPIAITATTLVALHAGMMIYTYFGDLLNAKIISGVILIAFLVVLLFSGLLRRKKATGKRRRFHYLAAFVFFGFLFVHIFIKG